MLRPLVISLHLAFLGLTGTMAMPSGTAFAQEATADFAIPAGPLQAALATFSTQTKINVSYAPATVGGDQHSPGVRGRHTAEQALNQLLSGSRLIAVRQGNGFTLEKISTDNGETTLAPVMVTATQIDEATEGTGSYTPRVTRSATRMALSLRETPQSVTVITSQQIEDRGITDLVDAMKTVTGIQVQNSNALPTLYSRGLVLSNVQVNGNSLPAGGQLLSGIQSDNMIAYDRIEVLRGANGLLTGPGDPSGTVMMVRKRPTHEFQAHVQAGAGSWSNQFADADISGALNDAGTVRGRVALGGYDRDNFFEGSGRNGKALLATVETDLTPSTVARLGYQHDAYTAEGVIGNDFVPLWYSDGTPYNASRSMGRATRDAASVNRTRSLYLDLEHAFGNGWAFQGSMEKSRREREIRGWGGAPGIPNYPDPSGIGTTMGTYFMPPLVEDQWAYNFDFQGPLNLFGREHRLMFGASGWDRESELKEGSYDFSNALPASFYEGLPSSAVTQWNGPYLPVQLTGFPRSIAYTEQHGAFAAARWNLADSLKLITGLRVTNWKTSTDRYDAQTGLLAQANASAYAVRGEITPYVGAVWDFHPNLSAYASYADIFKPQNLYDSSDNLLEPVIGKNYEAGVKGAFFESRLNASAAIFRVVQDNLGERDPNFPVDYLTPGGNAPYRSAGKGITTNGFEVEVSGSPQPRWNISAGYTYARSKNANGEPFNRDLPEQLLRVFTTYRLAGDWSGLTLGIGANWNSAITQTLQRPTGTYQANGQPVTGDYEFRQGSVWLVNAMVRYTFTPKLSLLLNVDNLFDKKYYNSFLGTGSGVAVWGEPRRWRTTLRYQF